MKHTIKRVLLNADAETRVPITDTVTVEFAISSALIDPHGCCGFSEWLIKTP